MDLVHLPIEKLAPKIKSLEVSPVELTRKMLERIEAVNPELNAFITVDAEKAILSAEAAEKEIAAGHYRGPLHGIPFSLKDIYATKGLVTTNGSKVDKDFVPDFNSTVAQKLKDSGAILLGKVSMHEYAYGVTNNNEHFGAVHNPLKHGYIPGGSSGGSGAAVGASLSTFSMGTDTGGSIRIPAACCGVVGLKPTYGLVSKHGVTTLSWSLDHAGPLAKSVKDAAYILNSIASHDPQDQDSVISPKVDYTENLEKEIKGIKVAVVTNYFTDQLDEEVAATLQETIKGLKKLGAVVNFLEIPSLSFSSSAHFTITRAEATSYHREGLLENLNEYGKDIQNVLLSGDFILASDYLQAQKARRIVQDEFNQVFEEYQVILTPTLPVTGAKIGQEIVAYSNGYEETVLSAMIRCSSPFNLTGQPAITIPVAVSQEGLPIGMQFAGKAFDEKTILQVAYQYEKAYSNIDEFSGAVI